MSHQYKDFKRKSILQKNIRELQQKNNREAYRKASIKEEVQIKAEKIGYLKIGDIISLWSKEEMTQKDPVIIYKGVVFGDGIAYTDVECIPILRKSGYNQKVPFRQSLFRIEPAYQYGLLSHYKHLIKVREKENTNLSDIERLKQKLNEEMIANETELELSYGRTITYGERIQLRHLHSNFFISISDIIAKEHGCLKVVLDENGSESSWLEILPSNKLRQEGEPIRYIDKFVISSRVEKSLFFLHMGVSTIYNFDMNCELNSSDSYSLWSAHKYISYTEIKKNPLLVSSGDSFTIFSPTHGGYLSVAAQNVQEMLPSNDLNLVDKPEEIMVSKVFLPKRDLKIEDEGNTENLKIFIENLKTGRSLWELERTDPFRGGVALYSENFRIKHVATGMYLEIDRNNKIRLKHDPNSVFNVFCFVASSGVNSELNFNTQIEIRGVERNTFLGVAEADILASFLSLEKESENFKRKLQSYSGEERNVINTTFVLIDVPEMSAIHIYQISRIIPKIIEFYSFLRTWGMLPINQFQFQPDYDYAQQNEQELKNNANMVNEILKALSEKIIKEDQSNSESLIRIQETIKDTGLLDLFLRLAGLISERIPKKKYLNSNKKLLIFKGLLSKTTGIDRRDPGEIAEKYLKPLIVKLYNTIHVCIKNSPSNCEVLKNYDEFLSYQLNFYKSEVSLLLKETFKHSVDIMNKISVSQFGVWAEQVTQLDEKKNIVDQTLVLMILSSFCVYRNKGIKKYQSLIERNLFSVSDEMYRIKLIEFASLSDFELIGFMQDSLNESLFLNRNPTIAKLYEKKGIKHPITGRTMIPLQTLNEHKPLVNYVAAFIELLSNMCLSRFESVKPKIEEIFGFNLHYIMDCIQDMNVHLKLRTKFMKLARVMYIDVDPLMPISKSKNLCIYWDNDEIETDFLPETNTAGGYDFFIGQLKDWVVKVWTSPHFPIHAYENYSKESKLKFTIELLHLTKCLLNLRYLDFTHFIIIYSSLVKLLFDYSNDSVIKYNIEPHWCRSLKMEVNSFSIEKINLMIFLVLKIFKVGNCLRKIKEIKDFLGLYSIYLNFDTNQIPFSHLVSEFQKLSAKFDFSKAYNTQAEGQHNKTIAGHALLSMLKKGLGFNMSTSSFEQPELYQLDSCLLGLLFKNSQKKIELKALNLILENFNHRDNLFKDLSDIHLVYTNSQLLVYKAMNKSLNTLQELISKLLATIDINKLEGNYNDDLRQGVELSYIDNIMMCMQQIKSLLMISQPREHLTFAQGIARSLRLHTIILKFLTNYTLPWIKKIAKRNYISKNWKNVYKTLFHALFSYTFKNEKNKSLMYPYFNGIAVYFGNGVGTSTLISEVLSCLKKKEDIERIIMYIFSLLEMNENLIENPHDLKMLLNLIVDDKRNVHYFIQVNVIKTLVSSKTIVNYYRRGKVLDFTKYSEKHERFQAAIVMLLAYCCQNNEFAIKQCHKILPYHFVMKELIEDNISFKLKRAYLHYLGFAFCNPLYERIDYDKLDELFRKVIIPDLVNFRDYMEFLPSLARKEAYKAVNFRKEIRVLEENGVFKVKEYLDDDEEYVRAEAKTTDEEKEALDYLKYLIHAKPWKIEMVSGLLIFIHNLSIDMNQAEYIPTGPMKNHFEDLTEIILNIKYYLSDIADQHPKLNFDFLIDTITMSTSEIPMNFSISLNEEEVSQEFLKTLLRSLGESAKNLSLSGERFIREKLRISGEEISLNDLTAKCMFLASTELSKENIYKALSLLNKGKINVENFISLVDENIKLFTFKRAYSFAVAENSTQRAHINSNLKVFIEKLKKELQQEDNYELNALVRQVKTNIVDVALQSKDFSIFYKFTRNLEQAFSNPDHKVYLLKIFRQMIIIERENNLVKDEVIRRVQQVQSALISVNISELCLRYLTVTSKKVLISRSLKLLHELLNDCHFSVKESIYRNIIDYNLGLNMFSFFRNVFNETLYKSASSETTKEKSETLEMCQDILVFLKYITSECFAPLQNYIRAQDYDDHRISIDLVSEIAKFASNFINNKALEVFEEKPNTLQKLVLETFQTLTEFCKGPCMENQETISKNYHIFRFINWFCKIDFKDSEKKRLDNPDFLQIVDAIVVFLLSLLEGDSRESIPVDILNNIELQVFLNIASEIYSRYIKPNFRVISQENFHNAQMKIFKIVKVGFNITILFLKFQYKNPKHEKLKIAFSTNPDDISKNIHDDEAYNYQEAIIENLRSFWVKCMNKRKRKNTQSEETENLLLKESHLYYTSNIGSVEIQFKQSLCKIFFRIPPMCKFLTRKSRNDIFMKVKRNSHQEKIEDFFDKSKFYEYEMKYQQWIGKNRVIAKLVSYWNFYGLIAFMLVIVINITLLVYYDQDNYDSTSGSIYEFLETCGQLQLFFAFLYLVSYTIEYFRVIIYRELNKSVLIDTNDNLEYQRIKGTLLMRELLNKSKIVKKSDITLQNLLLLLKDFQFMYCVFYFIISVICEYNMLIYSLLLLDLIKRNGTLLNILKSISINYDQIVLTLIFGVFICFVYSTIYFLAFSNQFTNEETKYPCDSFSNCFATILNKGVRSGGGIGDLFETYTSLNTEEVFRIIVDLSFFIFVIIILLNIIFGIIIDTFAQLRDERNETLYDIQHNCFICGNTRFHFGLKKISWKLHVHLDHSIQSYLAFIVYIKQKLFSECNGVEKYIKEKINANDVSFFPRTSISLQKFEEEFKDTQSKIYQKYIKRLKKIKEILMRK